MAKTGACRAAGSSGMVTLHQLYILPFWPIFEAGKRFFDFIIVYRKFIEKPLLRELPIYPIDITQHFSQLGTVDSLDYS
jgi:hypothetical protein